MADRVQLEIKVNADTGQLEVLGAKFGELSGKAGGLQGAFGKLGGEAGNLLKSFLPLATATGVVAFFGNAIKAAEEENESLRRLKFTIESSGQSWEKNKVSIQEWSQAIQNTTRFSDGAALAAMDKLARATGNVSQAQKAANLAMSLSVATGKDLGTTTELVSNLINKQERAVTLAHREFGTYTQNAHTAQEVLDVLQQKIGKAAFEEDSLTKKTSQAKNAFHELSETVGNTFAPVAAALLNTFKFLIQGVDRLGTAIASLVLITGHQLVGFAQIMKSAFTMDWAGVKAAFNDMMMTIQADAVANSEVIMAAEAKKTEAVKIGANTRINVILGETEAEKNARLEAKEKALQMEAELEQKIQGLGVQTYQKRLAALDAEVMARRAKANKEITIEVEKSKVLAKIDQFEKASKVQLAKDEIFVKQEAAFNVANLAIQTLQTVNSLGDKGSEAERTRAKALLALQQAVAIGWAWVHAVRIGGPFAPAIAAAETALIVAQFAQGVKQIDQAGSQEAAGIQGIKLNDPIAGIDLGGTGSPGSLPGSLGSGGSRSFGSGGSGGGGGGATVINVGGIVVNFSTDKLSVDNVDAVMLKMYEKLRQGTIEGVQLALQFQTVATRNSNLAA